MVFDSFRRSLHRGRGLKLHDALRKQLEGDGRSLHRGRGLKHQSAAQALFLMSRSLHRGRGLKLRDEISDIEAQISRSLRGGVD